jgi:ABC-2 type transport system ATP-binding protein
MKMGTTKIDGGSPETSKVGSSKNGIVISVANLKKRFGDLVAVDGLSFDVYKGEIFGFLGPNGAGKTTTINMVCGLSEPTEGQITVLGNGNRDKSEVKIHIGLCPQENVVWPKLTCLEQLTFMGEMYGLTRKAARTRSEQLLEWMALEEKSNVLAGKLSGGMKRRLNFCLALVHSPEILILDEHEAGLDPQSRILVRDLIKNLAKDKTIILTTHNMDEADRLAGRVAIIDQGKLLLLDTPENLKRTVGEGDVVEIDLDMDGAGRLSKVVDSLLEICDQVYVSGATLIIKSKNLIELVSDITSRIKEQGFKIQEITLRENTLEDVFIHLTGRRLRQ